ncbi:MAG: DUF1385 domain-containing protein [Butyrivibrio sp.]|nr:DUF1385 domain-containing protein [Butyrivibrio sp.]
MKKNRIQHYSGIGGQAVIEGVMMRHRDMYAVAVRRPDGQIAVDVEEYRSLGRGSLLLRIPFVRGFFIFLNSLILGMKSLNFSASVYEESPAGEETGWKDKLVSVITTIIAIAMAVGIFVFLPYLIVDHFGEQIRNASLKAIMEGVVRIAVFVIYVLLISLMKDIRRLFRYHGAEHKCINCLESGHPLTTEYVRKASRFHKRCGSSFILFVMLVSIVVFFFIRVDVLWQKLILRILLIPVISGISYELIALAGRSDFFLIKLMSAPGMLLQRLTTKEPDDQMIEVAIRSVEAVFDWRAYLNDAFGITTED